MLAERALEIRISVYKDAQGRIATYLLNSIKISIKETVSKIKGDLKGG